MYSHNWICIFILLKFIKISVLYESILKKLLLLLLYIYMYNIYDINEWTDYLFYSVLYTLQYET